MQSLDGWPRLSRDGIKSLISRQEGGVFIQPRVTAFYPRIKTVITRLASPASAGDTEIQLPHGLPTDWSSTGWDIGERVVMGDTERGRFDAPELLHYDPATGIAKLSQALRFSYPGDEEVRQQLPVVDSINGLDHTPAGVTDTHSKTNDISRWVDGLTIDHDTTRDVHREFKFNLHERDGVHVDLDNVVFKHWVTFYNAHPAMGGEVILDVPRGWSFPVQWSPVVAKEQMYWQVTAQDRTCLVSHTQFLHSFALLKGTSLTSNIRYMLTMDSLPAHRKGLRPYKGTGVAPEAVGGGTAIVRSDAGPGIRFSTVAIPNILDTQTGREATFRWTAVIWPENDVSKLSVCNEITKSGNCWPLYATSDSVVRTTPMPYYARARSKGGGIGVVFPKEDWAYETDSDSIFIDPQSIQVESVDKRGNMVVVTAQPGGTSGITAIAMNVNPESAVSIPRRGRAVQAPTVKDDLITSQRMADDRAKLELQWMAMKNAPIVIKTLINPFHESHDALLVNYTNNYGRQISSGKGSLYLETGWTEDYTAAPFSQVHKCQKIVRV